MPVPNCSPSYTYRPVGFVASSTSCYAPYFAEHRSRLTAGNAFFRSKNQGPSGNNIALECVNITTPKFNIYVNGVLVRSYDVSLTAGGIADLRSQLNTDPISSEVPIEMTSLNYDIYDTRIYEDTSEDLMQNIPYTGLDPFVLVFLSGGDGGPTTAEGLTAIRTGPERTMFILSLTEDTNGADMFPPASRRVQQWNGTEWISYCNLVQGACPGDGTC